MTTIIEDKQRSHRFWTSGDTVRSRYSSRTGTVAATYDRWVWVIWGDSGSVKGCWQPDTEEASDLVFVRGGGCKRCGCGPDEGCECPRESVQAFAHQ